MLSPRSALVLLLPLLALTGCERGSPCDRVRCGSGRVCNPDNGTCVAKATDGGADAGEDGGMDGGVDGGADAGTTCTPACTIGVCDPVSGQCVVCLNDSQCSCPTAACDLGTHSCVTPPADAGIPVPVVGESCAEAKAIPFPLCSKTTRFRVDLGGRIDDDEGTCSLVGSLGHDAVFLVDLDGGYDLKVTTVAAPNSAAEPVTYLRLSPCEARDELVCIDGLGGPSSFRATSLPAGQYALVIDSFDVGSSGPVDVTVELLPPTAPSDDSCSSPVLAPLDGGSFVVNLSGYGDILLGTCNTVTLVDGGSSNSREAVRRVVLDADSDFHAVATAVIPDGGVDPVLYLRSSPCSTGKELVCVDSPFASDTDSLRAKNLPAGTYFLVIEGYGASGSNGAMTVTTWATAPVPPPKNDTCAAPRPITFPGSATTVSFPADTSNAEDDDQGSCSASFGIGRDLVFQLSLPVGRTVTITAQGAPGSATDPVLYLRRDACDGSLATEVACVDATGAGETETISRGLVAGEYFLFVDS